MLIKTDTMNTKLKLFLFSFIILCFSNSSYLFSQKQNPFEGKWDMVIDQNGEELPSWLEIRHSGTNRLIGRFVYAFGSARPIAEVKIVDADKFIFSIPPQWEPGNSNMDFEGQLIGNELKIYGRQNV